MVRWHHQLNGCEYAKTQGDSGGQGSLVCCSPWGLRYKYLHTYMCIAVWMVCLSWYAYFDMHRHISTYTWSHLHTQLTPRHLWACHNTCECHIPCVMTSVCNNMPVCVVTLAHILQCPRMSRHASCQEVHVYTLTCAFKSQHLCACCSMHHACLAKCVVSTPPCHDIHVSVCVFCVSWYMHVLICVSPCTSRPACIWQQVCAFLDVCVCTETHAQNLSTCVCAHHIRIFIHLTRSDGIRLMGFDRKCGLSPLPFVSYPGSSWRTWQKRSRISNIW